MKRFFVLGSWGSLALFVTVTVAQPLPPESQLRDQLTAHFSKMNLLPVFLPRAQEAGDVMELAGGFYGRRGLCFPKLKTVRSVGHRIEAISLKSQVEGNFGVGVKRVIDVVFGTRFASSSAVTLTFQDVEVLATTKLDLQAAFKSKKCPHIESQVLAKAVVMQPPPFFVLQEVYYARKALSVTLDADAEAQVKVAQINVIAQQLGLTFSAGMDTGSSSSVIILAQEKVPVAVRLAFIPRPVTYATLGSSVSREILGYAWEPVMELPTIVQAQALEPVVASLKKATDGKFNPLREE